MQYVSALIIGAGQAGLAMSHCLSAHGIDHVVLERGRVAERWHTERWDSLRLLTPNWMSRLPGWQYTGPDSDGYMRVSELIGYLEDYARCAAVPVQCNAAVHAVHYRPGGYRVETSHGHWLARVVVVATGHCDVPRVPAIAQRLPSWVHQLTPSRYRNPQSLADGGVLVVGASASGMQIAEELCRAGRSVSLSVGQHTRVPRTYRGQDIWWWLEQIGINGKTINDVSDLERARSEPSLQLVGSMDRHSLDLGLLDTLGVRLLGRCTAIEGPVVRFADDLADTVGTAQQRLERQLARIDRHPDAVGLPQDQQAWVPIRIAPPVTTLDLAADRIGTVLWATGFVRDYSWLKLPVLGPSGEIRHHGGITSLPGLYVLGLRFMRRRKSNFLDGVGTDARDLAAHIACHLSTIYRDAA